MVILKTPEQIELMRESAQIVSKTLGLVAEEIKPGVTPIHLDRIAEEFIRDHGAVPGFLGYGGFPNSLCISINEAVVHGIPNDKPLEEGDIVSIDCGAVKNQYYGDHAYTFEIGEVAPEVKKLLKVTKESLYAGIRAFKKENRVGDISFAIQSYIQEHGDDYGIVRELVGHGLGKSMHEDPMVPNYGKRGRGKKLKEGLVLAIEPMINLGTHRVKQLPDGWTIIAADRKPSAHFEHDVALVDGKPQLLSTFDYVYEALGIESNEEDEFRKK
ncbi:MAG TPA: type I methionyl aminopeptidase [Flavobacteriaceae bacterium]|nr:type I methionyl aminopeptidase [Flavobacteriaceae bacterium]